MIDMSMPHASEVDSNKIDDVNKESEDKDIDHTISQNEQIVAKFMGKNNRISCYVEQIKNADDKSILEVQFYKAVETNSPLKLKPLNSSVETAECEQII